ncbi:MAG TPA: 6,7-dimethyl-8-ribityllumazine synthase [Legionellales bacterium]|nr:6,7-dimethyl-8-ribityllumazine synthase [Legionellales bacterium]
MNVLKVSQALDVKACRVAIVVSMFNEFITGRLESGCLKHLLNKGVLENHITIVEVPGAVELPLVAKKLAQSKKYDVVIVLGCVIRGDTDHYDYVCQQVSYGCQHVALELGLPVIFGVLTTDNEEQALARVGGQHGHKGVDVAEAALAMFDIMKKIQ